MPHYKIQMLDVGYVETFPADFAFDGAYRPGEFFYSPFCFTLLRGEGKNILIDCGINFQTPERQASYDAAFGKNGRPADEVLATVGLKPKDIDAIIVTHCHWDHLSGLVYFPDSKVYVQKEEVDGWTKIAANPKYAPAFSAQTVYSDLKVIEQAEKEGRVVYLDGDADDLFPGVHVRVSKFGHSFAHKIILVDTDDKRFVVVGDICNRRENLTGTKERPGYMPNLKFAVGSVLHSLHAYDRILEWVDNDVSRVLPTHDGERENCYPCKKSELGLNIFNIYD